VGEIAAVATAVVGGWAVLVALATVLALLPLPLPEWLARAAAVLLAALMFPLLVAGVLSISLAAEAAHMRQQRRARRAARE
jgi:hypothetical protein